MESILIGTEMYGVSPSVALIYFFVPRESSSNPFGSQKILTSDMVWCLCSHRIYHWHCIQRFWVERALQDGKGGCGLDEYQIRGWNGWHHHITLVMVAMLFMLKRRLSNKDEYPLLSCSDIQTLLKHFLPRRDVTVEEVLRQMEVRHRKRQSSIDSARGKQKKKRNDHEDLQS